MFVINMICYNREKYPYIMLFGTKNGHYFVRYKREFVITVIVMTEFDCITYNNTLHQADNFGIMS